MENIKMTDQEIRRFRLKQWIDEHYEGVQAKFVSQFELNQGEISALLRGNRVFGERKARTIEEQVGMPDKWLDLPLSNSATPPRPIAVFDDDDPLPEGYVEVPHYNIKLSAGTGKLMWEIDNIGKPNRFRLDWCQRKGVKPDNLVSMTVEGDSMIPVFPEGASVTIDRSITTAKNGRVHAIDYFGEFYIKRLFRMPDGSIVVQSDNPDKTRNPDWTIEEDNLNALKIMGLIVSVQHDV